MTRSNHSALASAEPARTQLLTQLRVALDVPLSQISGAPSIFSLAVVDALRILVPDARVSIAWPWDIVLELLGKTYTISCIHHGGYDEDGMFCTCECVADASLFACLKERHKAQGLASTEHSYTQTTLADTIQTCVRERIDSWQVFVHKHPQYPGTISSVADEYFAAQAWMGKKVSVALLHKNTTIQGRFAGIDIWGRASVIEDDGKELICAPEQVSMQCIA